MKVPDHMVAEILDGEPFTSPRPAVRHAKAAARLHGTVGPFDRRAGGPGGPGGWCILLEPELHLGRDVPVPDLAGWRRERMPTAPDAAAVELAPDWACEVLSPRTIRIDRVRKTAIYAREGVGHRWLLDPKERTLEVFRLEGGGFKLAAAFEGDGAVRAEPFEAIEIALSRPWLDEPSAGG
jgi:Uma2 family endonuclease